jgi:hypothetical protein
MIGYWFKMNKIYNKKKWPNKILVQTKKKLYDIDIIMKNDRIGYWFKMNRITKITTTKKLKITRICFFFRITVP